MTTHQPELPALLIRALPFLRDEAAKYVDDGNNEPLELARQIEAAIDHGVAQPDGSGLRQGNNAPANAPETSPQPQATNPAYTSMLTDAANMIENLRNGDDAYYTPEKMDAMQAALRHAASRPADGDWVMVPRDPTQPMRDAGNKAIRMCETEPGMGVADRAFYAYTAMVGSMPDRVIDGTPANDREALLYLMQQFNGEVWNCERCGHAEETSTMDSANFLREYLASAPTSAQAGDASLPKLGGDQRMNWTPHVLHDVAAWHRRMNQELSGKGDEWAAREMWNCPHGRFATNLEVLCAQAAKEAESPTPDAAARARELLAAEYSKCGMQQCAADIRSGIFSAAQQLAVNAIKAALQETPPSGEVAIVCDWRDANPFPHFIEAEIDGKSVALQWRNRPDGLKELVVPTSIQQSRALTTPSDAGGEAVPVAWLIDGVAFTGRTCCDKTAIPLYATPPNPGDARLRALADRWEDEAVKCDAEAERPGCQTIKMELHRDAAQYRQSRFQLLSLLDGKGE